MDVSENRGTPKSSILIGFSIINHPFWSTPIFGNIHMEVIHFCCSSGDHGARKAWNPNSNPPNIYIPSLKLTCSLWKSMVGRWNFFLGQFRPIFRGEPLVSGGIYANICQSYIIVARHILYSWFQENNDYRLFDEQRSTAMFRIQTHMPRRHRTSRNQIEQSKSDETCELSNCKVSHDRLKKWSSGNLLEIQ